MNYAGIRKIALGVAVPAVLAGKPVWAQRPGVTPPPQGITAQRPSAAIALAPPAGIASAGRRPDRVLQAGHVGQVSALAFSPDHRKLATGGYDTTVRIWDVASGQQHVTLLGHRKLITAVAFSPDGQKLASASADGQLMVSQADTGATLYTHGLRQWVDAIAFSPDGRYLAVSVQRSEEEENSGARIQIYRADNGQEFKTLPLSWDTASQLLITAEGRVVASGTEGEEDPVNIWDLTSGKLLNSFPIDAQAISADGHWAVSQGEQGGRIALWDLKTGLQTGTAPAPYVRAGFAFSANGQRLLQADLDHSAMQLWDPAKGKEVAQFPGSQSAIRGIALSADGAAVAVSAEDGSVAIWDAATARRVQLLPTQLAVVSVVFTRSGELLTGDPQGVMLWDVATAKVLRRISHAPLTNMILSPDGNWLAVNPDYQLAVWNARSWAEAKLAPAPPTRTYYTAFGGAPAPAADISNPAVSWSRISDDPRAAIVWSSLYPLAISSDRKFLATAPARGGDIVIWDTHTGQKLRTLATGNLGINCLMFSPGGQWLLTGGQLTPLRPGVNLQEVKYGFQLWQVSDWSEHALPLEASGGAAAAFSPEGRLLAVGMRPGVIQLFDIVHNRTVEALASPDAWWTGLFAFSRDGRWLAQPGRKGVNLWSVDRGN